MKLPDDKKERNKILVLSGIGACAVLYGIYAGVIQPYSNKKKGMAARIEQLTEDVRRAHAEIDQMDKDRNANTEAIRTIYEESERFFLKPKLGGNYRLSAMDVITEYAIKANVDVKPESIREMGQGDVLGGRNQVRSYSANITLYCSYNDLVRFLRTIGEENPYIFVTGLSISAREGSITEHSCSIDVQWPIWADRETPDKLREKVGTAEPEGGSREG